jgi:hypothetical protein
MKKSFVVAALVVLCATTANATNMWLSLDNAGSPLGEVPMVMQHPGDEGWLYIWVRPDQGRTLQNFSLDVRPDHSDVIWFTGGLVPNPILGFIPIPGPDPPFSRFEFTNDSDGADDTPGTPDDADLGMLELKGLQGFSVANSARIGVGLGPDTADGTDPGYNPATDAWLLGSIHWKAHRPGHLGLFMQIGSNGLNNAGESSIETNVVFGAPTDPPSTATMIVNGRALLLMRSSGSYPSRARLLWHSWV